MNEHSAKSSSVDDEIDLSIVFKGIKSFFLSILRGLINVFSFFFRHKFVLIGLILIGGVLGYFWEQNIEKTYTNDLLVIPNFSSTDYLYSKVETLDKKLSQNDTIFLEDALGVLYENVNSVEIKPVIDIYNFVSRNETNQKLFQLLFEEEANIEFIENPINSRNFKFHHIYFEVKGEEHHEELSNALIKYINSNEYFQELKTVSLENLNFQLAENNLIINQIDSILLYAKKEKSLNLDSSGLSFSDNSGLSELLVEKKALIEQRRELQSGLVNQSEIIKIIDANYKVLNSEDILKKDKKKLFPLLLIVTYSLFFFIRFIIKQIKTKTS